MEPVPTDDELAAGYGGSRVVPDHLHAPPPLAHDGRGLAAAIHEREAETLDLEILQAVEEEAQAMDELLARLVDAPTILGHEAAGQNIMRAAFAELGLDPVDVPMDPDVLRAHPGASPFAWDVSRKTNVVATWTADDGGGRSLILNGHVDVVSPEPVSEWHTPPFTAVRKDDWILGRGAADMKCGLAAMVGAMRGLRRLGVTPRAPVHLQSVVEEECTGNGTLSCVLAGYTADAAVIAEPFGAAITTSQVGVLWFQVTLRGVPAHAADMGAGISAIEKSLEITQALRGLEEALNREPPPPYDRFEHPINLNVGVIRGGDWPSTVPGECTTSYRIALYPGMRVRDLQDRIEAVVAETAVDDPQILSHPPKVTYQGFACEGYALPDDAPLVTTLADSFARQSGRAPALVATTGTTDARVFGLYGNTPAVCFGPYAEAAHGVNERAYFPSIVQTAQVLGLFIKDWCGLGR